MPGVRCAVHIGAGCLSSRRTFGYRQTEHMMRPKRREYGTKASKTKCRDLVGVSGARETGRRSLVQEWVPGRPVGAEDPAFEHPFRRALQASKILLGFIQELEPDTICSFVYIIPTDTMYKSLQHTRIGHWRNPNSKFSELLTCRKVGSSVSATVAPSGRWKGMYEMG